MLPLLLLLVLVTPTVAHATNESSYKYGFKSGFEGYRCVITEGCDNQDPDAVNTLCPDQTNSTACNDGYINGWKAYCKAYINDCLDEVQAGLFPDKYHVLLSNLKGSWTLTNATTYHRPGLYGMTEAVLVPVSKTKIFLSFEGVNGLHGYDSKGNDYYLNKTGN